MTVPEAMDLVVRETGAFRAAYPHAAFEVVSATSRAAVTRLLEGTADMAVLTRQLEPEERNVVVKGGLGLEGYRFARDAVCIVVNDANPVRQIAADDLRRIYLGQLDDWRALGGRPGRIEPVVPAPESDLMTTFIQRVMGGEAPTAPAYRAASDSDVVARVRRSPQAVGFVSMAWSGRGVRALDVAALTGLPYWNADAEKVYKGQYPLTRSCNMYVRAGGARLANGFVTWIASIDGQRIVYEAGLVPSEVPVRFARRSPMLGSH